MSNRFSRIILIFVTVFCFFLMFISYAAPNYLFPLSQAAGLVLTPLENAISTFGHEVADRIYENRHLREVYDENMELSLRLEEMIEENNRLRQDSLELSRLRELYELDSEYMDYPKVSARVIASDSDKWFNIIRIDKGLSSGIEEGMNVLYSGGLLGIVTEATANYSTVRTIIDDESNVYAESLSSGQTCLVKGGLENFESGMLDIVNIDKNAVFNEGDAVVTSNLSTKYLPGILIGYAYDVSIDSQHLTKSAKLVPVADFSGIKEVLVITMLRTDAGIVDKTKGGGE